MLGVTREHLSSARGVFVASLTISGSLIAYWVFFHGGIRRFTQGTLEIQYYEGVSLSFFALSFGMMFLSSDARRLAPPLLVLLGGGLGHIVSVASVQVSTLLQVGGLERIRSSVHFAGFIKYVFVSSVQPVLMLGWLFGVVICTLFVCSCVVSKRVINASDDLG